MRSLERAAGAIRDALLAGLNELADQAGIAKLDLANELAPEGTQVSAVVTQTRASEPPPRD